MCVTTPTCQVCGDLTRDEVPLVACQACATPYHKDCWGFTGQCATFGCGSKDYRHLHSAKDASTQAVVHVGEAPTGRRAARRRRRQLVVSGLGAAVLAALVAQRLHAPPTWGPPTRQTTAADRTSSVWQRLGALVEAGEPAAQVRLGWRYETGEGIRQAPDQAAYWYQRAAEHSLPAAWNLLGRLTLEGRGLPKNSGEGRGLIRQAAEAGDVRAQANLGVLLLDWNEDEAAEWFERAAPSNAIAAFNLARYLEARGREPARVDTLLRQAASELPEAQEALAARDAG